MFWSLEEWQGKKGGKKDKKEKRTCTCVEEKKRGKKKEKRKKEMPCEEDKKKEGKKKEKRRMKYYHNIFTINFKGYVITS